MLTYCLKFQKNTKYVDSKPLKTKNGRTVFSSKYVVSCSKNSTFIKEQVVKRILSSLDLKIPLSKILLFGDIFF